jgi:hypothetical protein
MVDLAKLSRFLDSVRGTDKTLMVIQYSSKLIIWYLNKRTNSTLATRIANLAGPVSDFRILLRYYGLIPLVKWIIDTERNPDPNPRLQLLGRLQNIVNLLYYPLEHAYWLGLHQVIPMSDKTRDKIGMWSCRFWAAYVIFYFLQLWEEKRILNVKENTVSDEKERKILARQKKDWVISTLINTAYFPLTVHWSLESSSFPDVGVGFFGTIAALLQWQSAWKAA